MRYIVLYMILILWATSSETAAQKPTIDLLPSTHEQIHPDAVVDTSVSNNSLSPVSSGYPGPSIKVIRSDVDSTEEYRQPQKASGLDPMYKKRSARKVRESQGPGNNPLTVKNLNPIRFLFYMTALNL